MAEEHFTEKPQRNSETSKVLKMDKMQIFTNYLTLEEGNVKICDVRGSQPRSFLTPVSGKLVPRLPSRCELTLEKLETRRRLSSISLLTVNQCY